MCRVSADLGASVPEPPPARDRFEKRASELGIVNDIVENAVPLCVFFFNFHLRDYGLGIGLAQLKGAIAARKAFDLRTGDPVIGCGAPGMPRALTAASPMTFTWVGDELEIRYESMDVRRTVKMNGTPPDSSAAARSVVPPTTRKS